MKTIRELADELCVSKPTVNAACESLKLKSEMVKRGNRYYINDEQEVLIRAYLDGNPEQKSEDCDLCDFGESQSDFAKIEKNEKCDSDEIEKLTAEIESMQKLLDEANKRLDDMQRTIDSLTSAVSMAQQIADQAQRLQLQAQNKVKALEQPKRRRTLREILFGSPPDEGETISGAH